MSQKAVANFDNSFTLLLEPITKCTKKIKHILGEGIQPSIDTMHSSACQNIKHFYVCFGGGRGYQKRARFICL